MNIKKTILTIVSMVFLSLPYQVVEAAHYSHEAEDVVEGSGLVEAYLTKLELGDGALMPRFIGEKMTEKPSNARIVVALAECEHRFRLALGKGGLMETCYASHEAARGSCRILRR